MPEKKIEYDEAYSVKTSKDSIKLYKKWAKTFDKDEKFSKIKEFALVFRKKF